MKRIFTILVAVLLSAFVFAQTPEKMSYQAVIRNSSDALVTNTQIGMEINIRQGSPTGTIVYTETQTPTTNANGLVSIEIGGGAGFNSIDWSAGPYFLETKTDIAGGTNYTITGTSQLLSVPYALHAKTAETVTGGITETDPIFGASPANGITSGDISNWNNKLDTEVDGSVTNELQTLSISNDTVYLSNGGFVKLPAGFDGTWTSLTGKPTFATVATSGSYNDLSDKPTIPTAADGSETKLTAGTNVTIIGSGTTASPYVINASSGSATHYVGELYGGGVVFWVDHTGSHGLIVSMVDLSAGMPWSNITSTLIGTTNDWDGASNTSAITGQSGHTNSAAKLCEDYTNTDYGTGVYSDWYLPSIAELNHLWNNFYEVQKALTNDGNAGTTPLSQNVYWSSSEYNNSLAWYFFFNYGSTRNYNKDNAYYVRAVRAF